LRAVDGVGNVGAYTVTSNSKLVISQETAQAVSYGGGWKRVSVSGASAGYVDRSANGGATATYVFTGRGVAFVSTRATSRGIADIWLDGKKVATVDLYSKTSRAAVVAWSSGVLANTSHKIVVKVTGDKNKSASSDRVDVDAFIGWQ
jgi:hypothetical protein